MGNLGSGPDSLLFSLKALSGNTDKEKEGPKLKVQETLSCPSSGWRSEMKQLAAGRAGIRLIGTQGSLWGSQPSPSIKLDPPLARQCAGPPGQ